MQTEHKKPPLIVFSGGLDSTQMLVHALNEGNVYTCYFEGGQSENKIMAELAARKKIMEEVQKRTQHRIISDTIVKMPRHFDPTTIVETFASGIQKSKLHYIESRSWTQPFQWLFSLTRIADGKYHDHVQMGYVATDGITMHLHDIVTAWNAIQNFSSKMPVALKFPMIHWTKRHILRDIPQALLDMVWVCELPLDEWTDKEVVYKPCTECASCLDHQMHLWSSNFHQRGAVAKEVQNKEA